MEPSLHLWCSTCSQEEQPAWPPASPCLASRTWGWQHWASQGRELLLSATLQPCSSWPCSGLKWELLTAFWQRQQGRHQRFGFSGYGVSHISLPKGIHISFLIPTSLLTSLCSPSGFLAIPVPEDGAAKPVRVPVELMWLFCFLLLFIICIPAGSEGLRPGEGLFLSVLLVRPLNQ